MFHKLYLLYLRYKQSVFVYLIATFMMTLLIIYSALLVMTVNQVRYTHESLQGISCSLMIPQDNRTKENINNCLNENRQEQIDFKEPKQTIVAPDTLKVVAVNNNITEEYKPVEPINNEVRSEEVNEAEVETVTKENSEELPKLEKFTRIGAHGKEEFRFGTDTLWLTEVGNDETDTN